MNKVPKTAVTLSMVSQLSDSVTSVGANDREANAAQTAKDFCHKYGIVKRETDESIFWIKTIKELFPHVQTEVDKLIVEGNEISKIVAAIIRNSKNTSTKRKSLK